MGYCTSYELSIIEGNITINEIYDQWNMGKIHFEGFDYAIDEDGMRIDDVKWYDHVDDMRVLSKLFPDVLFLLYGEGEDSGDVWKKYFKNGKMHNCSTFITFEEYDESQLR